MIRLLAICFICLLSICTAPALQAADAVTTSTASSRFDIVVYGGTPAGIAAAVAAARDGKSVAIVEQLEIVGGMMSGGLSFSDSNQTARETLGGIFEEFHLAVEKHYTDQGTTLPYSVSDKLSNKPWTYEPHVAEKTFRDMLNTAGVKVHLGEALASVQMEDQAIRSITTRSGQKFSAGVFIDASYEGDLLAAAGVSYRVGRESSSQHNESLAGARYPKKPVDVSPLGDDGKPLPFINETEKSAEGQGDDRIMAYSFRFCFSRDPANQVPFTRPADYDPARYELFRRYFKATPDVPRAFDLYRLPNNKLDGNNGIGLQLSLAFVGESAAYPEASYEERQRIWQAHRSYSEGFFYFLKTDDSVPQHIRKTIDKIGYAKDEFEKFGHFPPVLYVREARRMEGAYFLTQADILENTTKTDCIAIGSFPIDSHDCQRIAIGNGSFLNEGTIYPKRLETRKIGQPHQLPYRAITPKAEQCENLLVPVCLSASHVALSSVRVEPTWIVLGQSAGIAASLAIDEKVPVQQVEYAKLKQRLIDAGQVLELPAL